MAMNAHEIMPKVAMSAQEIMPKVAENTQEIKRMVPPTATSYMSHPLMMAWTMILLDEMLKLERTLHYLPRLTLNATMVVILLITTKMRPEIFSSTKNRVITQ